MVFDEVECDARRHRRRDVLLSIRFAVSVHIDVQPFAGDVVAVVAFGVVVVADDWRPLAPVQVLQLHHEPRHLAVVVRVAESPPDSRSCPRCVLTAVLPRFVGHSSSHTTSQSSSSRSARYSLRIETSPWLRILTTELVRVLYRRTDETRSVRQLDTHSVRGMALSWKPILVLNFLWLPPRLCPRVQAA